MFIITSNPDQLALTQIVAFVVLAITGLPLLAESHTVSFGEFHNHLKLG
jgi:hypothetical protein